MNKNALGAAGFAAGIALGYIAAERMLRGKYEQLVQEEVDSVKAALRREREKPGEKPDKDEEKRRTRRAYAKRVESMGYAQAQKDEPEMKPRVISPDEFGEMDGYEEISLTLYADGTLADDGDRAMSDAQIEESVGRESLTHFGEYEADSVFVRNDRLKVDYEILADPNKTYADVLLEKPFLTAR